MFSIGKSLPCCENWTYFFLIFFFLQVNFQLPTWKPSLCSIQNHKPSPSINFFSIHKFPLHPQISSPSIYSYHPLFPGKPPLSIQKYHSFLSIFFIQKLHSTFSLHPETQFYHFPTFRNSTPPFHNIQEHHPLHLETPKVSPQWRLRITLWECWRRASTKQ